jgi:hypothetical protein
MKQITIKNKYTAPKLGSIFWKEIDNAVIWPVRRISALGSLYQNHFPEQINSLAKKPKDMGSADVHTAFLNFASARRRN